MLNFSTDYKDELGKLIGICMPKGDGVVVVATIYKMICKAEQEQEYYNSFAKWITKKESTSFLRDVLLSPFGHTSNLEHFNNFQAIDSAWCKL